MIGRKATSIILIVLLFSSYFACADSQNKNEKHIQSINDELDEVIVDVPEWNVGDSWTYDIFIDGSQADSVDFDLNFNNMKIEVTDILTEWYRLDLYVSQGDLLGDVRVNLDLLNIQGSLINTGLDGYFLVNKTTLAFIDGVVNIDGYVDKVIDIHINLELAFSFFNWSLNKTSFTALDFPLSIDKTWSVPFTYLIVNATANLIPQPLSLFSAVEEYDCIVEGWDVVVDSSLEYDALLIKGDIGGSHIIWYSLAIGNILKTTFSNMPLGFDYTLNNFEMILKSTTYETESNPPEIPSLPIGPTSVNVGEVVQYETSSSDPDGDMLKYIVDWGDGLTSASEFLSSSETTLIPKTWTIKGDHDIKVKARDIYGKESDWSDTLTVTVVNTDPEKPTKPVGETHGKIKTSYSYTTSSSDPEDHRVQYGWDWNGDQIVDEWTELYKSGTSISTDHTWYDQGTFDIRVIAQDEYGEESEWSDPLNVIMPKFSKYYEIILEKTISVGFFKEYLDKSMRMRKISMERLWPSIHLIIIFDLLDINYSKDQ